jgi:hypothetical protein
MKWAYAFLFSLWAHGCGHATPADPINEYLGDWQLNGGDKDENCGSGVEHSLLQGVHVVRFIRGNDSDLTLQFFEGAGTVNVNCEFPFDMLQTQAILANEHTCVNGNETTTWHSCTALINDFGYLQLNTQLTDSNGCTTDARPVYVRSK